MLRRSRSDHLEGRNIAELSAFTLQCIACPLSNKRSHVGSCPDSENRNTLGQTNQKATIRTEIPAEKCPRCRIKDFKFRARDPEA
jgi:hypothetical protein